MNLPEIIAAVERIHVYIVSRPSDMAPLTADAAHLDTLLAMLRLAVTGVHIVSAGAVQYDPSESMLRRASSDSRLRRVIILPVKP